MGKQKGGKKKVKVKGKYDKIQDEETHSGKKKNKGKKGKQGSSSSCDDYALRQLIEGADGKRQIIEMAADGNCLFRSISHQLYNDFGKQHDTVRHEVCNFLEKNKEEFSIFLLMDDDEEDVREFDSYVEEMRDDGTWGGDVEIVCAARLYKRQVTIFSSDGVFNIGIDEEPSGPDILLSYHENSHYNSVHDETAISLHEKKNAVREEEKTSPSCEVGGKSSKNGIGKSKSAPKKNDPCPCGSNLRYKKCCLAIDKSRIRSEKYKEKTKGTESTNNVNDNDEDSIDDSRKDLESSLRILTI